MRYLDALEIFLPVREKLFLICIAMNPHSRNLYFCVRLKKELFSQTRFCKPSVETP